MSPLEAIAEAANTVEGINVSPGYRQSTKPGTGFVMLDTVAKADNSLGFVATWDLVVACPQDLATADQWIANHLSDLLDAVDGRALTVTAAERMTVVMPDGNNLYALVITGARALD